MTREWTIACTRSGTGSWSSACPAWSTARSIRSGDWHYVSPAIERVLGWTPEEWRTHEAPWGTSLHEDDRETALRQEELALETGSLRSEYRMRRKDGAIVWIRDEATLLEEDGDPQWHGILTDVTEERALEYRLRQSQKLEAVGQLAGGIAHDFNNLLVAIRGYGELALARAGEDERAALRARADRRRSRARPRPDPAPALVQPQGGAHPRDRRPERDRRVRASHAPARARARTSSSSPSRARRSCAVVVDPTELDQSLLNLCVNARDAMPHGGRLSISTGVERRELDGLRAPARHRHGTGIEPEVVPHVFEPFFTTKDAGHGTGLGLAMVGDFVTGVGGLTEIHTTPGAGTSITLLLPRAEAPAPAGLESPATPASAGTERILLIEDDDSVRELARRVLAGAGYTVIEARYGTEALELADADPAIDAVLSDVVMPGLSGPEVVGRLQARRPELAAVFMSGYAPESEGPLGGADLVRKPFTGPQLLEALRKAIDARPGVPVYTRPSRTQPLWPPRPIAFESATSSSTSRASFGT